MDEVVDDGNGSLGKVVNTLDNRAIFFTPTCHLPMSKKCRFEHLHLWLAFYKWTNLTREGIPPSYTEENGNVISLTEYPSLDYPLMRLAEAYLNYAEAAVRKIRRNMYGCIGSGKAQRTEASRKNTGRRSELFHSRLYFR